MWINMIYGFSCIIEASYHFWWSWIISLYINPPSTTLTTKFSHRHRVFVATLMTEPSCMSKTVYRFGLVQWHRGRRRKRRERGIRWWTTWCPFLRRIESENTRNKWASSIVWHKICRSSVYQKQISFACRQ